jgi:hypothetical protein
MMQGIMGNLGQQVQDSADTTQITGKPPASAVPNDLLNLMATQKIAREKDAAIKELQMAQQNNPATIKDQLEQKVMGMTQSEMTNQTAGILKQRAMQKGQLQQRPQQQQRPQGIQAARPPMGGAPRPPMGGAPRPPMGGLPAAGAPRPPMMASGGIVGFQQGGQPRKQRDTAEINRMRRQNEAEQKARFGKNEEIRKIKQLFNRGEISAQKMQADIDAVNARVTPAVAAPAPRIDPNERIKELEALLAAQKGTGTDTAVNTAVNTANDTTTTTTTTPTGGPEVVAEPAAEVKLAPMQNLNDTAGGLEGINFNAGLRKGQNPAERVSGFFGKENEKTLSDAASQNIMGRVDDKGQFQKGLQQLEQDRLDDRYKIGKRDDGLIDLGKDVSKEERRQMSPEVQRAQRLQAARGTYSQLARNRGEVMDKQNEQRLQFSKDKLQRYVDRTDKRIEALAKVDANVASTVASALKFKSDALTSLVNLSSAKATDVQQQADSFIRQNSAEIANRLTAIGIGEEANLRITMQRIDQTEQLDKLLMGLVELRAKYESDYLKTRQLLIDRIDTSTNEGKMELSAIQAAAKTAAAAIGAPQEKIIQKRVDDLTGVSFNPASLLDDPADSPETFDTELEAEADEALLNRNKQ